MLLMVELKRIVAIKRWFSQRMQSILFFYGRGIYMNLKIKGLKKIADETKSLCGYYSGLYLQLNYNMETGEA